MLEQKNEAVPSSFIFQLLFYNLNFIHKRLIFTKQGYSFSHYNIVSTKFPNDTENMKWK